MKKKLSDIFDSCKKRRIFLFIAALILVNTLAAAFFIHAPVTLQRPLVHQILVEKVISAINFVNDKPLAERKKAVNAMTFAYSALGVNITDKPRWHLQLTQTDVPNLREILLQRQEPVTVSFRLNDGKWLNVHIYRFTHYIHTRFMAFSVIQIFVIVGILLYTWSSNRFAYPIASFKEAVEKIGTDLKNPQLINLQGPEVVREAARAVNNAHQRIQDLIAGRTRMLAAISHDLRTPITRMRLQAQFVAPPEAQTSLIANLDEMNKMITEILAFAKMEAKTGKKTSCDLVSLLEVICNDAVETGWDVVFKPAVQHIPFNGHILSLKRAFTNLLDNATRYGKKAQVRIYTYLNSIAITITDEGPGIPLEEQQHIFEPFQRGTSPLSRDNTSGTGLGLAIAYDIIQAHNGKITLKNLQPQGLRVKIKFSKFE